MSLYALKSNLSMPDRYRCGQDYVTDKGRSPNQTVHHTFIGRAVLMIKSHSYTGFRENGVIGIKPIFFYFLLTSEDTGQICHALFTYTWNQ